MHWREEYEIHSEAERRKADAAPVESLLEDVRRGRYGNYYGIWYSIAERASLASAGWILFDVLNRDIDFLYRYHCAAALLALLGSGEFLPVQLSGGAGHGTAANLGKIDRLLTERIGARGGSPTQGAGIR